MIIQGKDILVGLNNTKYLNLIIYEVQFEMLHKFCS